jgi:hypothetical protein
MLCWHFDGWLYGWAVRHFDADRALLEPRRRV